MCLGILLGLRSAGEEKRVTWSPQFECVVGEGGEASYRVGHVLIDEFLEFIETRARPNTVKAYAHDLKVFFTVVAKEPAEVTSRDVLALVTDQQRDRAGADNVVRILDRVGRVVGSDDQAASRRGVRVVRLIGRAR